MPGKASNNAYRLLMSGITSATALRIIRSFWDECMESRPWTLQNKAVKRWLRVAFAVARARTTAAIITALLREVESLTCLAAF